MIFKKEADFIEAKIGNQIFQLEKADSWIKKSLGLSWRSSLPENTGMIFLFKKPGYRKFWMLGMRFSLDIVWLNNKKVVHIEENAKPGWDSLLNIYYSGVRSDAVMELPAGSSLRLGIKLGEAVSY